MWAKQFEYKLKRESWTFSRNKIFLNIIKNLIWNPEKNEWNEISFWIQLFQNNEIFGIYLSNSKKSVREKSYEIVKIYFKKYYYIK